MATYDIFINTAEDNAFNSLSRQRASETKKLQIQKSEAAKNFFSNYELAKSRANVYRNKALDNLDKVLLDFESNFNKNGGKVIWANNEKEAQSEIIKIAQKNKCNYLYLSDSSIAQELKLEVGLNREKISIFGQEPYKMTVCQANFICVEGGMIVTANNNFREQKIVQQSDIQVYLIGIESITQSLNELDLLLQLQSLNKIGESSFEYSNFISGSKSPDVQVYLMLVDNGRTTIHKDNAQKSALNCIQCNSCISICNVTNLASNKAYDSIYTGPIGSIISSKIQPQEDFNHLYFASLLEGEAEKVCPVKIDFSKILLHNRKLFIKSGLAPKKDNISFYFWKNAMLKRNVMDKGGATFKNFMLRQFFKKSWGSRRDFPIAADKSFNQQWRERKSIK